MSPKPSDLQNIPNAVQPTPGQGLTLDLSGVLPPSVIAPTPTTDYVLAWNGTTGKPEWRLLTSASITDGTIVNADINASAAIVQSKIAFDAWTTFTPALTAATSNPTLGTGPTDTGRYVQVGKTVIAVGRIVFGTGATAGTGTYAWSLPVTAATTVTNPVLGVMRAFDNSATNLANFSIFLASSTTMNVNYPAAWPAGANTLVGDATPWVWADSDQMNWLLVYEAA